MSAKYVWTADKIATRSVDEVKSLRNNAEKAGAVDVVELCDADLLRRNPPKVKAPRKVKVKAEKAEKAEKVEPAV
jgi:hypothetical protein